jgi:hypothetical protein
VIIWCVQHRDGWCATKGGAEPSEKADYDPTACGDVVTLRIGSAVREPDCGECRKALEER